MDDLTQIQEATQQIIPMIQSEPPLTDEQKQRWIWLFDRFWNADISLTHTEKAKIFCEANSPEEIEQLLHLSAMAHNVVPLAA